MKRAILPISILIAIVLLAAVGWYFFSSRQEMSGTPDTNTGELPFGSGDGFNIDPNNLPNDGLGSGGESGDSQPDQFASSDQDLFRIANTPIAGSVIFERANQPVVRYVERATGHIHEVVLPQATTSSVIKTRLTNNTLPKIYQAYFRSDGGSVLLRSLREDSDLVENTLISIAPPSTRATTSEFYTVTSTNLRGSVGSVAAGAGNNLFYTLKDTNSIVTSTFTGTNSRTLLSSPYTGWRLINSGDTLIAYSQASRSAGGIAYRLNSNGALTKLVGPLSGLTAISNRAGTRLLYSYNDGSRIRLFARQLSTNGVTTEISSATLSEKCVWSSREVEVVYCASPITPPGAQEPDSWYQGKTVFTDRIWRFETSEGIAELLVEPKKDFDIDVDAIDIRLSPDEDYLIFTNKRDYSLWALRLTGAL